jgi:tetratricopeptide (TPR) repeat protein
LRRLTLAALAGLLSLAGSIRAGELESARALYEEMEYEPALEAAGRALAQPEASPAELAEAYRIQGLCLSVLERSEEALAAFRHMLSIAPDTQLPADTSPKLAAPFYQAVAMARDIRPIALKLVEPEPPGSPGPRQVMLLSDPFGLVKDVRLVSRLGPGPWQRGPARDLAGGGQAELELPRPPPDLALEYYLEALNPFGGVLARLGGPEQPFRLHATQPVVERVVADAPVDAEDEPTPWHRTWWFWTAVGVVVVGTAVGLGVGLGTAGGDGGGPRDYTITFP